MRDRHWDTVFSESYRKGNDIRTGSTWFDYTLPECTNVTAGEIPGLRPYDYALSDYAFDGISLKLKVGRWETEGVKEVWQLRLSAGYAFSWDEVHPFTHLYDVFSGSVRLTLEGMEPVVANARDLLHIPRFIAGRIEALEDTVLLDMGCQGYLTRLMDELNVYKVKEPGKLKDKAFVREIMDKNGYHVLFESL